MKQWVIYNSSGRILRRGSCQDMDFDLQAFTGEIILEGIGQDNTHYVLSDTLTSKVISTIEVSKLNPSVSELITLAGVPADCLLEVTGPGNLTTAVVSPIDTISFDFTGIYTLKFLSIVQLPFEVDINVN